MSEVNCKILIYGAGSMGTALGALLDKAGISSDLASRDTAHIEALRTKGANISGTIFFSSLPFDGKNGRGLAMLPGELSKKYDVIFLLTKPSDNAATAEFLAHYLAPNGVVCTLQNGIPEPSLAQKLDAQKVLGCICVWGAQKTAPGVVCLTSDPGSMSFGLGSTDGSSHPMLPSVRDILEKTGKVTIEENFIGVRWSKLLINAAFSGLSVVTGWSFGRIASSRKSRRYVLKMINECIAVCRAAKVKIEPVQGRNIAKILGFGSPLKYFIASLILPFAIRKHRDIKSGMLRDIDRGKPCEINNINGVVSNWGKKYGVCTPINDRIIEIVHSIEKGARKYGSQNLELMRGEKWK